MSYIVVDVEADGETPGNYSMVCFGAVIVDKNLDKTFYGETKPISNFWKPDALAISGFSRSQHEKFKSPETVIVDFAIWILENSKGKPVFLSDNLAFDWQWINYYMHTYNNSNPFGFSGRRIGDIWCGFKNDMSANREWKQFRKARHTHNPVDDAIGNAEALLEMKRRGVNLPI